MEKGSTTFKWTESVEELRKTMTRGNNFYGELYWDEEENFLIQKYNKNKFEKTLCLGCGFFRELETLQAITSKSLVGIDIEKDLVIYIKDNVLPGNFNACNANVLVGDILKIPLLEDCFNLVSILFQSLGNVGDQKKALKEIKRVCAGNGTILISYWNNESQTTDFRMKNYFSYLPNSKISIVNDSIGLKKIILVEKGKTLFSSLIFEDQWFYKLFKDNEELEVISITKKKYCSILELNKKDKL